MKNNLIKLLIRPERYQFLRILYKLNTTIKLREHCKELINDSYMELHNLKILDSGVFLNMANEISAEKITALLEIRYF